MIVFPKIQQRAQAELDRVVGRERLPSFDDFDNLHFIRALIQEVIRKWPVAPLGVPHSLMKDDVYEGYKIPNGTMVIPNIW